MRTLEELGGEAGFRDTEGETGGLFDGCTVGCTDGWVTGGKGRDILDGETYWGGGEAVGVAGLCFFSCGGCVLLLLFLAHARASCTRSASELGPNPRMPESWGPLSP